MPTPTINASTLLPCFTTGDPPVSYGCYIYTIAGGNFPDVGDGGPATQAVLERPDGILAAPDGSVYISDTWNNRVRRVRPDGIIETIAGTGSAETQTPGDGGPAKQANVRFPRGLALGSDGLLYIADTNFYKIRRIDRAGIINSVAGKNCCFFEGENVPATEASFVGPFAIAFDKQGNLYIADGPAHRVRRVGLDGKIRTMAGTGEAGNSGDGGAATNAKLNSPKSLAVDDRNRLLIASTFGGPIRRVDLDTGIISTLQGVSGYYVSIDAEGKIYVATGQQIFRVDPNSGATTLVAGTNRGGNSTGDNAPAAQATFAGTGPLSVDAQGNIYVIDIGGSRVRRIGKDGIITNFAGGGKMPGDNVPALEAIVYDTQGIGLDGAGNLFFNDFDHFTIRRLGLDGIVTTLAGDRFSSRPSDGGHPLQAYIQSPIGIVFDARGNLLFIDANNSIGAVRLIMPGADGVVDGSSDERIITVAGQIASRDQADHGKADGGPAKNAVFNAARDLAMDSKGNLYVADVFDNRVRKIVPGSDGVLTAALDEIITTFAGNG
ncbi:MAG: hypothetical protein HY070_06970, partial [Chloroflexi bacterium]|nr:hypothetical protein [Chloroflexota bacterium]